MKSKTSTIILLSLIILLSNTGYSNAQSATLKQDIKKGDVFWLPIVVKEYNSIASVNFTSLNGPINFILANSTNYNLNPASIKNPVFKKDNITTLNEKIQLTVNGTYYFGFQDNLFNDTTVTININIYLQPFDLVNFLLNLIPYVIVIVVIGLGANYVYENYYINRNNKNLDNNPSDSTVSSNSSEQSNSGDSKSYNIPETDVESDTQSSSTSNEENQTDE